MLTCISTTTAAQTGAIDDEVFAIYQALLRDSNVGVRAFSAGPVTLRREAANMGFYISARLINPSILPEDIQRALRNPVGPMALPNKLADEPGIALVEKIDCPAAQEERARQLTLTRIGLAEDRNQALVAISNCDTGRLVQLRKDPRGWTVAREVERFSWPRYGNGLRVELPRPPSFEYVDAVGCGDLVLMAWNPNSSEVLSITLDLARPTGREMSVDLAKSAKGIEVRVDAFEGPQGFSRCGDLGTPLKLVQDPTSGWLPVGGKLKLRVDRQRMTVAVEVRDLVVKSVKGDQVRAKDVVRFVAQIHGF